MATYTIDADGTARDPQTMAEVAFFAEDGEIYGRGPGMSRRIGRLNADGTVYSDDGELLGQVNSDGSVWEQNQQIGSVSPPHLHRQGALLLLL